MSITVNTCPPLTVTIPYPANVPRRRGIHAVDKFNGKLHVDLALEELDAISEAAAKIGITKSMFVRWVCAFVAKEIINVDQVCTEPVQAE